MWVMHFVCFNGTNELFKLLLLTFRFGNILSTIENVKSGLLDAFYGSPHIFVAITPSV